MNGKAGKGRMDGRLGYYIELFNKLDRGEIKFTKKKNAIPNSANQRKQK